MPLLPTDGWGLVFYGLALFFFVLSLWCLAKSLDKHHCSDSRTWNIAWEIYRSATNYLIKSIVIIVIAVVIFFIRFVFFEGLIHE